MSTVYSLTDRQVTELVHLLDSAIPVNLPLQNLARNKSLFLLMLDAGLRVGETVRLCWLNFQVFGDSSSAIEVPAAISKSNVKRTIPCTSRLYHSLLTHRSHFPSLDSHVSLEYMFPGTRQGSHLTSRQAHRIVSSVGSACLKMPVHPHLLRHTFATRMMRIAPLPVVQATLGHKSVQSTQIYVHPNSSDISSAISKLE